MKNDSNINVYIGNKIKDLRVSKNITQAELGEYLNTTSQTISRYENGKLKTNQEVLFKIAEYFKISINDFFPPICETLSNIIGDTMYEQKTSISQLAILTDLTVLEIKDIYYGNNKLPKPSSLIKLAIALSIEPFILLKGAGYIDSEEYDILYETGIRYLLTQEEREILCKYITKHWNQNTGKHTYTYDEVYNTIFSEDKDIYTAKEVKDIIEKKHNIIKLDELENELSDSGYISFVEKYKDFPPNEGKMIATRMYLRDRIYRFTIDSIHRDLLLNCEMLNNEHAKIINEQVEYYIEKEEKEKLKQ